ncbi:hypothetical protein EAF04_008727 [Stromatinia cepivora]|nr:hypothetical protein EAF04_008727 [Stromatinia cepivora]
MSFTDFPRFTELPKEIRLQIWRIAAEQALNPRRAIFKDTAVRSRDIAVLKVNQEAREEALFQTDLGTFRRRRDQGANDSLPSWDWFSMETDIFVIRDCHRIPRGLDNNVSLRDAIQTIAIPLQILRGGYFSYQRTREWGLDQRFDYRSLDQMFDYRALKTVVLLRDDEEQEKIPYVNLVLFTSDYPRTGDLRITIYPTPLSQLILAEAIYCQWFLDGLVTRMQKKQPGWRMPEIRWGCLVRH